MGQQQLLLLVLGIVIVGIAVVAGIQAFSEGKSKSERDAAASDAMRIVSDAQAWRLKPQAFGGGAGKDLSSYSLKFQDLGYPNATTTTVDGQQVEGNGVQANGTYKTVSGCYTLSSLQGGIATLSIELLDADGVSCSGEEYARVNIMGTTSNDIIWTYNTGSESN